MLKNTGPGPNAYHLPHLVGYEKHDPTKTRMPAYTMGQRLPPGPALTTTYKDAYPGYKMAPQPKTLYCGERNCVRCSITDDCCIQKQTGNMKKTMPTYKLTYFPVKALAEPIRFMLSYMDQEFEDFRFERENWPSIKPTTPFGKAPVLEIDGKKLHQSTALCRYLGKEAGLAGSNNWEDLQIDIAIDTLHDLRQALAGYFYESDEAVKEKKKALILSDTAPFYLQKFDELVKANGGFLANGKLSWGDLYFIGISDYLNFMLGFNLFDKHENLRQLRDKVVALPKIKEWIAKRPVTDV